jgi:hypothetical protein
VVNAAKPKMRPQFQVVERDILARGLLSTHKWKGHTSSLSTANGIVGEELRLMQVDAEANPGPREIVQGALPMVAPPEMWACENRDEVRLWCEQTGNPTQGIQGVTIDGRCHYAYQPTEIDVTVLRRHGDRLSFARVENVKAGDGEGPHAREQNEVARAALADANLHFCVPTDDGGYEDWTGRLDRAPDVLETAEYITVGPAGDYGYDVQMPLSEEEIVELSKHLLLADWDRIRAEPRGE